MSAEGPSIRIYDSARRCVTELTIDETLQLLERDDRIRHEFKKWSMMHHGRGALIVFGEVGPGRKRGLRFR